MPSRLLGRTSVAIETHGCKLNQSDTAVLAARFESAGFDLVSVDQPTDVYLVNSCTVTHIADRKARRAIRSARRRNPNATIVATGCYAERDPYILSQLPEVDLVVGNMEKVRLVQEVLSLRGKDPSVCGSGTDNLPISPRLLRTRAMVKIQEGCDQICAYCIVPKVRGRERSIPTSDIVTTILGFVSAGYREVVLTGTQLGTYGFDLDRGGSSNFNLTELISTILSETEIERLRVSSLQPQEIDETLLGLWSSKRLCPHFHMPLQSGSDAVLKRMRRTYTAAEYERSVDLIRSRMPDAGITADIIAGFPGETVDDFRYTYQVAERVKFSGLHIFPFSSRPGTTAAHFNDELPVKSKASRVNDLIALGESTSADFKDRLLGTVRPVLWEERKNGNWTGLTDNYVRVEAQSGPDLFNTITPAKLTERNGSAVRVTLTKSRP